jgi:tetratricopeptide (TPR) repeat protein
MSAETDRRGNPGHATPGRGAGWRRDCIAQASACATTARRLAMALACAALAACAAPSQGPPAVASDPTLLHDELFTPASVRISADDIFALSEPMKRYLRTEIATQAKADGLQGGLVKALYDRGQLKLEYDSSKTRSAAEAFDARAGNCLSLVVMTAAFAKELGLQLRYQSAYVEETWTRNGNLLLRAGHVNITLGPKLIDRASRTSRAITIDFLPHHEALNLRAAEIPEQTIIAMFMNNRAVEAVVRGQMDDAYAWTRAALGASPGFLPAYNTLGIIYKRREHLALAEAAFRHVLQQDPQHTRALANLAEVVAASGRGSEAEELRLRLAQLEPEPPLHLFNLGLQAMERQDYRAAREFFGREAARSGYSNEVSYWLGLAMYRLGDFEQASVFLNSAIDSSTSAKERERYSAKLARLKGSLH